MQHRVVTVAAVQLNSQAYVEANLERARELVLEAADAGAELVLLPENFAFFGSDDDRKRHAEPLWAVSSAAESPIQSQLARWAALKRITVVGGGMPTLSGDPDRPYNTCVVFGPNGRLQAHYHKVHLFDVELADGTSLRESRGTRPGSEVVVAELPQLGAREPVRTADFDGEPPTEPAPVRVALSVCYDLRFPELYRAQAERGADLMLVPAAFTSHTGKAHWEVLLRARAIENQAWVLAAGQYGDHGRGRHCHGHSLLVDPWGHVIARSSDQVGLVMGRVDLAFTAAIRQSVPALLHRRM